jgi:hypothetical protein
MGGTEDLNVHKMVNTMKLNLKRTGLQNARYFALLGTDMWVAIRGEMQMQMHLSVRLPFYPCEGAIGTTVSCRSPISSSGMYSETHIDNIDNNEKRAQLMKIGHPRLKTGATQRPTLVTKS